MFFLFWEYFMIANNSNLFLDLNESNIFSFNPWIVHQSITPFLAKRNSNMTSLFQRMPHINQWSWPFNFPVYYKLNLLTITCANITHGKSTCLVPKRSHRLSIAQARSKFKVNLSYYLPEPQRKSYPMDC